jgi:tetratricopeptide (TPR) repeat protein
LNQAVDYFMQAIVRDPNYAEPYVGLADCYNLLREFSAMPPSEAYPRALAAARKAVELAPNSSDAHTSLAFPLFWWNLDVASAAREFKTAIALNPNNARAHHWYATFLVELGHSPEALAEIDRARRLDPSSTAIMADKGFILMISGQTHEALALLKQVEALDPNFSDAHLYLSMLYYSEENFIAYFDEAAIANRLTRDADAQFVLTAEKHGFSTGGINAMRAASLRAHQKLKSSGRNCDFQLAADYALLEDKSAALRQLGIAYANREPALITLLVNHSFDHLRGDPAFRDLVTHVGLHI